MERPKRKNPDLPLFLSETKIAERLGIGQAKWKTVSVQYERIGMPRRDPISGLRYWPAVKEFFDRENGAGGSNENHHQGGGGAR